MPIIGPMDGKAPKGRAVVVAIYLLLLVGGLAMVCPFLVMVTGSVSNAFDYERRSMAPRFLWSREDRFMRLLATLFPPLPRNSLQQMKSYFPDASPDWQLWPQIGDERRKSDDWVRGLLGEINDPVRLAGLRNAAADYRQFIDRWDLRETTVSYNTQFIGIYLRDRYKTLDKFNAAWELSVDDFMKVNADEWSGEPFDLPTYLPGSDARYLDLLGFRQAYRDNLYTPWYAGLPANCLRPACLRFTWENFVRAAGDKAKPFEPVSELPFPVPSDARPDLVELWHDYLQRSFPLRHIAFSPTPALREAFRQFLVDRFRTPDYAARVLDCPVGSWDDLPLTGEAPSGTLGGAWCDFVRNRVPVAEWQIRDTLPEQAFQKFALAKYGSLERLDEAYGLSLRSLQQLHVPYRQAILATFAEGEWSITLHEAAGNYRVVFDNLFLRGNAVRNTVILIVLALLITLTVNPLCAYALSRFRLRPTEKILVFCLTTMAFPAAVSAIPGFLLLRDLNLLNTFAALVLPGAANGMTIFILKGFFDSLPQELFEAATIDGASEWQVFTQISLPLVKPILAVSLLSAFVASYAGWEWALIVCQDQKMWTISVWTYQFSQTAASQPFVVMAAYVITSIPVLAVFLFCQNWILRGIVLPQLK